MQNFIIPPVPHDENGVPVYPHQQWGMDAHQYHHQMPVPPHMQDYSRNNFSAMAPVDGISCMFGGPAGNNGHPHQGFYRHHGNGHHGHGRRHFKGRRAVDYFNNAPPKESCTILPVDQQDNKEFESVRSAVASVVAVVVMLGGKPAETPSAPQTPREAEVEEAAAMPPLVATPTEPQPYCHCLPQSPLSVQPTVVAAVAEEQLSMLNAGCATFEAVSAKLVTMSRSVRCRDGLSNLANSLVTSGVQFRRITDECVELVAVLGGACIQIQDSEAASSGLSSDGESTFGDGEEEVLMLGSSAGHSVTVTLLDMVVELCCIMLDESERHEMSGITRFVAKLAGRDLAPAVLVRQCVSKIMFSEADLSMYMDGIPESDIVSEAPCKLVRQIASLLASTHPDLRLSCHLPMAISYAAYYHENFCDSSTALGADLLGRATTAPAKLSLPSEG